MTDDELLEKMSAAIISRGYNPATANNIACICAAIARPIIEREALEKAAKQCEIDDNDPAMRAYGWIFARRIRALMEQSK